MIDAIDNELVEWAIIVLVVLGALNWGLVHFLDVNLITDVLGIAKTDSAYTLVIGAIAGSAVIKGISLVEEV